MIDLVCWLTGLKPQTVSAFGNDKLTKKLDLRKKFNCNDF